MSNITHLVDCPDKTHPSYLYAARTLLEHNKARLKEHLAELDPVERVDRISKGNDLLMRIELDLLQCNTRIALWEVHTRFVIDQETPREGNVVQFRKRGSL